MSFKRFMNQLAIAIADDWDQAKSDWRLAKKQMDQIQGPSLYKEDD